MTAESRVPQPADLNGELFAAIASTGRLHLQRCDGCRRFTHPPRYFCVQCSSDSFAFVEVSGRGFIYSWGLSHTTTDPGWKNKVPYLALVVELEEGARIVASAPSVEDVRLGLQVSVGVDVRSESFALFVAESDQTPKGVNNNVDDKRSAV